MNKQVYFEDVITGEEIPHQVVEVLTARSIVKWAAAVRDFYEIHYDKDFARAAGMRDVIAHGPNKCALLSRLLLEWMGEAGTLHKISCIHKASNFPGDKLTCKGKVNDKYRKDGRNYVECEVWVENQDGIVAAPGKALISLPAKDLPIRLILKGVSNLSGDALSLESLPTDIQASTETQFARQIGL